VAAKTVLIGTPRKDAAGSPAHEEWTTGDTPQDPDGNALLTSAAGGGSPVNGLKNATVIASGTTGTISQAGTAVILLENSGAVHRFYWVSTYHVTPGTTDGEIETKQVSTRRTGGNTQQVLAIGNGNPSTNITVAYKVYRVDES
jgi:hypothetical protein